MSLIYVQGYDDFDIVIQPMQHTGTIFRLLFTVFLFYLRLTLFTLRLTHIILFCKKQNLKIKIKIMGSHFSVHAQ